MNPYLAVMQPDVRFPALTLDAGDAVRRRRAVPRDDRELATARPHNPNRAHLTEAPHLRWADPRDRG